MSHALHGRIRILNASDVSILFWYNPARDEHVRLGVRGEGESQARVFFDTYIRQATNWLQVFPLSRLPDDSKFQQRPRPIIVTSPSPGALVARTRKSLTDLWWRALDCIRNTLDFH